MGSHQTALRLYIIKKQMCLDDKEIGPVKREIREMVGGEALEVGIEERLTQWSHS